MRAHVEGGAELGERTEASGRVSLGSLEEMSSVKQVKQNILSNLRRYYDQVHTRDGTFVPGQSRIPYAGRCFDCTELEYLIEAALEFWLTHGHYAKQFEQSFGGYLDVEYVSLVNSGSSANLLAFAALTSPLLNDRRVKRGDEIITVAACFPTTVAPITQYGAVPVFVDVELGTANIDVTDLQEALSSKTKAVMLAHTLGNPFNLGAVKEFCARYELWLVEDNCDSLGSTYKGRYTGTWGDIGTSSFYPPHHISMGEGGAVYTDNPVLHKIIRSLRDWGRDCWCESGQDNTCGQRFSQQFGTLPVGYDHKYVYSHLGYNLKATDLQAAIGCAQLEKLEGFVAIRKQHFEALHRGLADLQSFFILPQPQAHSNPSWFGFLIVLKDRLCFSRNEVTSRLEARNIQTRNLFAGNLTRHPCFETLQKGTDYRMVGDLANTDKLMNKAFWVGVYPGMSEKMLNYMIKSLHDIVDQLSTEN